MAGRSNRSRGRRGGGRGGGADNSLVLGLAALFAVALASGLSADEFKFDLGDLKLPTSAPTIPSGDSNGTSAAIKDAKALTVKGRAPKTGYSRDAFGTAWKDVDRNGCDTRNDILARDLTKVKYNDAPKNCVVATGVLADPYTGKTIEFTRGQSTSTAVQIDHIVALSDAWQKGAQSWDKAKREKFANDPANLLAVDGPTNGKKGDGDAATWLPPNKAYRCTYVTKQVQIKKKYGLWVTQAEQDAIIKELSKC